jgi:AIPR protein
VLVNGLQAKQRNGKFRVAIDGISIVNGAQTTGAIGSLTERPKKGLSVAVRFIWTKNEAVVENIIKYNNSQNKISASDFRSTDAIQKRLKAEFAKIPVAEYEGGRRGGASDRIKRRLICCRRILLAKLWQHFTAIRLLPTIENRIFGSMIERTQTISRMKLRRGISCSSIRSTER